jgi:hypothetical protein
MRGDHLQPAITELSGKMAFPRRRCFLFGFVVHIKYIHLFDKRFGYIVKSLILRQ